MNRPGEPHVKLLHEPYMHIAGMWVSGDYLYAVNKSAESLTLFRLSCTKTDPSQTTYLEVLIKDRNEWSFTGVSATTFTTTDTTTEVPTSSVTETRHNEEPIQNATDVTTEAETTSVYHSGITEMDPSETVNIVPSENSYLEGNSEISTSTYAKQVATQDSLTTTEMSTDLTTERVTGTQETFSHHNQTSKEPSYNSVHSETSAFPEETFLSTQTVLSEVQHIVKIDLAAVTASTTLELGTTVRWTSSLPDVAGSPYIITTANSSERSVTTTDQMNQEKTTLPITSADPVSFTDNLVLHINTESSTSETLKTTVGTTTETTELTPTSESWIEPVEEPSGDISEEPPAVDSKLSTDTTEVLLRSSLLIQYHH